MFKKFTRLCLAILCISFVLTSQNIFVGATTDAYRLGLQIQNNQKEFLTGSGVVGSISIRMSGAKTLLKNTKLKVTIPKEWLDPTYNYHKGVKGSSAFSLLGDPIIENDVDNYYITFNLKPIAGGQFVKLPFIFQTKNLTTPDGSIIPITGEFLDENNNVLDKAVVTIVNRSSQKFISRDFFNRYFETVERNPLPNETPSDIQDNEFIYVRADRAAGSSEGGLGIFQPEKVKVSIKVNDDIYFDPVKNSSWTWDENTRIASKTLIPPTSNWAWDQGIFVKKVNQPYDERFSVGTYTVAGVDKNGNDVESSRSEVSNLDAMISPKPKPIPVGIISDISIAKRILENQLLIHRPEDKGKITKWDVTVTNTSRFNNPSGLPTDGMTLPNMFLSKLTDGGGPDYSNLERSSKETFLNFHSFELEATDVVNPEALSENIVWAYTEPRLRNFNPTKYPMKKFEIARNVKAGQKFILPNQDDVRGYDRIASIEIEFTNRIELKPGQYVRLNVETTINSHDWDNAKLPAGQKNWDSEPSKTWEMLNIDGHIPNGAIMEYSHQKTGTTALEWAYRPSMKVVSGGNTLLQLPQQTDGNLFRKEKVLSTSLLRIQPNGAGNPEVEKLFQDSLNDVFDGKYITLLPIGWNYVPEESFVTYTDTTGQTRRVPAPEVIYDYMGTGKRALVVQVDGLEDRKSYTPVGIEVQLQAMDETPRGESKVLTYFVHENNGTYDIGAIGSRVADEHDFDLDGNKSELIPHIVRTINYLPPEETIARMYVGRTLDNLSVSVADAIDAGDDFWYGYEVENLLELDEVLSMTLWSIKSFEGNKTQVPNNNGLYTEFGTTKTPYWTGPIRVLKNGNLIVPETVGYDVYYSTTPIQNGNIQANYEADFTLREADITDWSKVTMFKIDMREPAMLDVRGTEGSKVMFVNPANTPKDMLLEDDYQKSINSFSIATSTIRGESFHYELQREVFPVVVPYINYTISGTLYRDFNFSGKLNSTELRFPNIRIGLFNEAGEKIQETTTSSTGEYSFNVTKRANYKVKLLETPETYKLYDANNIPDNTFPYYSKVGDEARVNYKLVGHDVDANGESDLLELNPKIRHQIVDIAFVEDLENVPVQKEWLIPPGAISQVKLMLKADGQILNLNVTSANNWRGEFVNLRKRDAKALPYNYILSEEKQGAYQYFSERTENGFVIKNFDDETINIPVRKVWKGEQTSSVTIVLYNGDVEVDRVVLNNENQWQHTFVAPKKDGKNYPADAVYRIEEIAPSKYSKVITGNQTDGFVVTNTNNEMLQIPVEKIWFAENTKEVTVELLRNNEVVDTLKLNSGNRFKGIFSARRFDEISGEEYKYEIREKSLENYESSIVGNMYSGFIITNKENISFDVTKEWIGGAAPDKEITVNLYRKIKLDDGSDNSHTKEIVSEIKLNSQNNWTSRFEKLPKTNEDGTQVYVYGVEEITNLDGYRSEVTGDESKGFVIKNINQEKISFSIKKVWVGQTKDSANIVLLQNGNQYGDIITITSENNWTKVVENLPKYNEETGDEYVYTIREEPIKDFSSQIEGNANSGFTVTNTFEAYTIKFKKVDADDVNTVLGDVVFELKQGEEIKYTATSNNLGEVVFSDVLPGEYDLVEKTARYGYHLDTTIRKITVSGDSKEIVLDNWTNKKILLNIKLTKVDANTKEALSGVVFALKDGDRELYRKTTDENGVIIFENVPYGTYTVEEIEAKEGYLPNTDKTPAIVNESTNVIDGEQGEKIYNLGDIENQIKKGFITVSKVAPVIVDGVESKENYPLKDVTFGLYKKGSTDLFKTSVTDENGIARFEDVPYGQYEVKEISVPEGYTISNEVREVSVIDDGVDIPLNEENGKYFVNQWIKGTIKFKKVDSETKLALSGVKFALYYIKNENEQIKIKEAISDESGMVIFENVPYGRYVIKEIETLSNYNLSDVELNANIEENDKVLELADFENRLIRGSISFIKKDATSKEILKGAKFALLKGDEEIATAISDDTGRVLFENVLYGDYKIKEIEVPSSYNLSNEIREVSITKDGEKTLDDFFNTKIKSNIEFIKVDAEDKEKVLEGATFVLKVGDVIRYEAVSDKAGKVTFENVEYGDYTLEETKTLENYNLSDKKLEVSVKENNKLIEELLPFENRLIRGNISFTKKDADSKENLEGAVFVLLQKDEEIKRATSDKNGRVVFENIAYGDYQIKEIQSPSSYNLSNEIISVSVREDSKELILDDFFNTKIKSNIEFLKISAESGKALEGAKFVLKVDGVIKYEAISDKDGRVIFEDVVYGDYTLEEEKAPLGYDLSFEKRQVKVRNNKEVIKLKDFYNYLTPSGSSKINNEREEKGSVSFFKKDKENGEVIEGTIFILLKDNNEIKRAVSDKDGRVIFEDIEYGDYQIKELETTQKYILSDEVRNISITKDKKDFILDDFFNEKIKSNIEFLKLSSESGKALEGAKFVLKADGVVKYEAISDKDGRVIFEDVVYGDYILEEVSAPFGYEISTEKRKIQVRNNLETIQLDSFVNEKISKEKRKVSPKTNDNNNIYLYSTTLITSSIILALHRRKRKFNTK